MNTIKIGIADGGDSAYDSNLLIAANSVPDVGCDKRSGTFSVALGGQTTVDLLANDSNSGGGGTLSDITKINGVPVTAGGAGPSCPRGW